MTSKRGTTSRSLRRAAERQSEKEAAARVKAARELPGGTPENPLEVSTPAVIEPRVEAEPCPRCHGSVRAAEHSADTLAGVRLRIVMAVCGQCGLRRAIYFRLRPALLH